MALWHWRNQSGIEVDLVIEKDRELIPVECKLAERPDGGDLKGVRAFRKFYGDQQTKKAFLACPVDMPFDLDHGVSAVPGWTCWEL